MTTAEKKIKSAHTIFSYAIKYFKTQSVNAHQLDSIVFMFTGVSFMCAYEGNSFVDSPLHQGMHYLSIYGAEYTTSCDRGMICDSFNHPASTLITKDKRVGRGHPKGLYHVNPRYIRTLVEFTTYDDYKEVFETVEQMNEDSGLTREAKLALLKTIAREFQNSNNVITDACDTLVGLSIRCR